jgi:hypothetical protein
MYESMAQRRSCRTGLATRLRPATSYSISVRTYSKAEACWVRVHRDRQSAQGPVVSDPASQASDIGLYHHIAEAIGFGLVRDPRPACLLPVDLQLFALLSSQGHAASLDGQGAVLHGVCRELI